MKNLKAIDFFCGAGGVTCGFREANIEVLGGLDINSSCRDTYEKNNPGAKFFEADISNLTFAEFDKEFDIAKNDDSLIFVGCSPCQYYTNLKTDKTKSEKTRLLLEHFQEFVEYYQPGFIFLENVPGLDKNPESPLGKFKYLLKTLNYYYTDGVLNAKYFGVPQNRRRYVLIASRISEVALPEGNKEAIRSVKHAIGDKRIFPEIKAGHKDNTDFIHSVARLAPINLKRIKSTSINGGRRGEWANDSELQLKCYQTHNGHTDVYGRMSWEEVSPAITTRFCSLSNGRYGHPDQDRAISLREGATLQSFPLNYKFYSKSQGEISQMIGNAVPPLLAEKIGDQILKFTKQYNGKI